MSMVFAKAPLAVATSAVSSNKRISQCQGGVRNKRAFLRGGRIIHASRSSLKSQSRRSRSSLDVQCSKVAVLGASGGIGQPLALLLKMNKLVTELTLYDIANTEGVAADLSHCNTPVKVKAYTGIDNIEGALKGADLVIIPAGIPRKPGMTRDDLFNINAGIVLQLVEVCAKHCPSAILNIISNPINSTVAIAAEALKSAGVYNPKKLIGVTTLDVVRSNTFIAEVKNLDVKDVDVPVIGGHAGKTILPLLSQTSPSTSLTSEEVEKLTVRIQNAGTEVVEAKAGAGSATLSMAYAAARMAESCLLGLQGEPDIYECAFVQSDIIPELDFFASKVQLGPDGVAAQLPLGDLSPFEKEGLTELIPLLQDSIAKGVKFATEAKVKA